MPRQYSPQFRQRVLGLLAEGRSVGQLAAELGIGTATLYRWQRQDRIDAGELPGPNTAQSVELADAKRRIRQLEEELKATRLAASMLKDDGIGPKDGSRLSRP